MSLKRRTLLKSLLIIGAVIPVGGGMTYLLKKTTPRQYIKEVLQQRLHYLSISDATIEQFSQDIINQAKILKLSSNHYRMINVVISFDDWLQSWNVLGKEREMVHDYLARQFLFSTDFFTTGSDITREPKYIAFYDPLVRPCQNPFSQGHQQRFGS